MRSPRPATIKSRSRGTRHENASGEWIRNAARSSGWEKAGGGPSLKFRLRARKFQARSPKQTGGIFRLPVDGLLIEAANSGGDWVDGLAALPGDKLLGLGVVGVVDPVVEDEATIRDRLARALCHVPAERLWATPDAGLRALDAETVREKLRVMVSAARSL